MTNKKANAIRFLSIDAIQKANSGHPGAPMGMAEIAEVLWSHFLQHNPNNPNFYNRDRFILSNGHASMLIYSLLHLTGYNLSIEDLKLFRQFSSKTPGHPEYSYTPGIETTTGPLGQGIANAVGMALAEKILAEEFNKPHYPIVDHHTYVFVGDGCLMEGISHEVCSLAGTLGLGKLIVFYDSNQISIDGHIEGWFTENVAERFHSYNWQVINEIDGHDPIAIESAIKDAQKNTTQPSIICCKTVIGKGAATKEGSHKIHGSPLGDDEIQATRKALNWSHPPFEIPKEIYESWDHKKQGQELENKWNQLFEQYRMDYPEMAHEYIRRMKHDLPHDFHSFVTESLQSVQQKKEKIATRKASQNSISLLARKLPELIGGSADLTPSNLTDWEGSQSIKNNTGGNYIHYGVREFGMAAIINGLFLHGGVRPFGATFLMFNEYARNALRMAALMHIGSIFVFTHDSIGLGEDGPTHQPVEQISSLRQIPNMNVWRPCDTIESFIAWSEAIKSTKRPSCLIFSRQNLPFIERSQEQIDSIQKGAYFIHSVDKPRAILIATGSEVELALQASEKLSKQGIDVNVVSMPSTNLFDQQDLQYKQSILMEDIPKIAIEAGITDFWYKYVGLEGKVIGIDHFGESAPAEQLFIKFGFTVDNVVKQVKELII